MRALDCFFIKENLNAVAVDKYASLHVAQCMLTCPNGFLKNNVTNVCIEQTISPSCPVNCAQCGSKFDKNSCT